MINIGGQNGTFNPKLGKNTCQCSNLIEAVWRFPQNHTHYLSKKGGESCNQTNKNNKNEAQLQMPSFMCLINLSDVLDHGKMVCIVRVEDGCHRHLTRFLVHILWSFAKGIGGWLIADFKPWESLTQPAGTKENRLSYWISLHYAWECSKSFLRKKHPQVSFFKRILNIYLHLLFLPCVFFWGEFPSAADEIHRWFISDAIEQQFPGCPEQFGAVHVLQGWLVIVCDSQLMSRFHQKWISPEPWLWILSKLPPK